MQQVLCKETCAALLSYINADSEKSKAAVTEGRLNFDEKFGGVNCRGRVPTRQAALSPSPRTLRRHSPCALSAREWSDQHEAEGKGVCVDGRALRREASVGMVAGKGMFGLRQDQWLPMEGIVQDAGLRERELY